MACKNPSETSKRDGVQKKRQNAGFRRRFEVTAAFFNSDDDDDYDVTEKDTKKEGGRKPREIIPRASKPFKPELVCEIYMSVNELYRKAYPVCFARGYTETDRSEEIGKVVFEFSWRMNVLNHRFRRINRIPRLYLTFYLDFAYAPAVDPSAQMFGLDCEMLITEDDPMALGRVAVVNEQGQCIYDTFVVPPSAIVSYATQYSGIVEEDLKDCKTTLPVVQNHLLRLLPQNAILVGHALDNDFRALRIAHPYVIDTATLFPNPETGNPQKLVYLAKTILGKDMDRDHGHNPHDDAAIAMELVLWYKKNKVSDKGDTGDNGDTGDTGDNGDTDETGDADDTGDTDDADDNGDTDYNSDYGDYGDTDYNSDYGDYGDTGTHQWEQWEQEELWD